MSSDKRRSSWLRDLTYRGKYVKRKPLKYKLTVAGSISALTVLALAAPSSSSSHNNYKSKLTTTWSATRLFRPKKVKTYRIIKPVHILQASSPFPYVYIVQKGDTLSDISTAVYGRSDAWTLIYYTNKLTNPDSIRVNQELKMVALHGKPPAPPRPPKPKISTARSVPTTNAVAASPVQSYNGAPGSFQACVIRVESGGNPTVVNPSSGAGGLYQFLPSTWAALGFAAQYPGGAQTAPVSVQNAAFQKLYSEEGTAPWAPYDGC